jgi:hypothetical protein
MTFFDARRYAESSIITSQRNQVNRQSLKIILTSLRLVINYKQPASFQSTFSFLFTIADKQSLSNSREKKFTSFPLSFAAGQFSGSQEYILDQNDILPLSVVASTFFINKKDNCIIIHFTIE